MIPRGDRFDAFTDAWKVRRAGLSQLESASPHFLTGLNDFRSRLTPRDEQFDRSERRRQ
jgi:hypothetical protein